jgi:hypothetical protein
LGVVTAGGSERRRGRACPEGECRSAGIVGSPLTRFGSSGAAMVRLRTAGKLCPVGTFRALAATVRTGRRRNSETSATTTGVAAALMSVPLPQSREAANAAAADARLAMITVSNEMPLPGRSSLRSALGPGDSTTVSLVRRTLKGRGPSGPPDTAPPAWLLPDCVDQGTRGGLDSSGQRHRLRGPAPNPASRTRPFRSSSSER